MSSLDGPEQPQVDPHTSGAVEEQPQVDPHTSGAVEEQPQVDPHTSGAVEEQPQVDPHTSGAVQEFHRLFHSSGFNGNAERVVFERYKPHLGQIEYLEVYSEYL